MFNKDNNKTNLVSDKLKAVKFHTMKNDLLKELNANNNTNNNANDISVKEISDNTQESSPFLNSGISNLNVLDKIDGIREENNSSVINVKVEKQTPAGDVTSSDIMSENIANVAVADRVKNINDSENEVAKNKSSALVYVIIFIIILLLGAGGYYYWTTRESETENIEIVQDNIDNEEDVVIEEKQDEIIEEEVIPIDDLAQVNDFSDKSNFLVIKDNDLTLVGIKKSIENKFLEIKDYPGDQLEFLLVDENNKPILFNDFVEKFKISLSLDIINNLEVNNFSLFLYKKDNIKRIGLAINIKNKELLKAGLLKNEKTLLTSLNSLFIYDKISNVVDLEFKVSKYKENQIRYVNLNTTMDLSIDYVIIDNYLVIATNKDSGRLIMDKLSGEMVKNEKIFSPEENLSEIE